MGALALIIGILGGLCAIMGIVTALEVVETLGTALTETFWLMLSGVLFLAAIALTVGRGGYD
ncbi:hypothetical protein ACFLTK_03800 [Chloroflexota bacterium]